MTRRWCWLRAGRGHGVPGAAARAQRRHLAVDPARNGVGDLRSTGGGEASSPKRRGGRGRWSAWAWREHAGVSAPPPPRLGQRGPAPSGAARNRRAPPPRTQGEGPCSIKTASRQAVELSSPCSSPILLGRRRRGPPRAPPGGATWRRPRRRRAAARRPRSPPRELALRARLARETGCARDARSASAPPRTRRRGEAARRSGRTRRCRGEGKRGGLPLERYRSGARGWGGCSAARRPGEIEGALTRTRRARAPGEAGVRPRPLADLPPRRRGAARAVPRLARVGRVHGVTAVNGRGAPSVRVEGRLRCRGCPAVAWLEEGRVTRGRRVERLALAFRDNGLGRLGIGTGGVLKPTARAARRGQAGNLGIGAGRSLVARRSHPRR